MVKKKKKTGPINFIVDAAIYPFDVMVSIGQDILQLESSLNKHGIKLRQDVMDTTLGYRNDKSPGTSIMLQSGQMIIRLRNLPETSADYGVLAHEIFHIATFILEEVGIKYSHAVSDEAFSYLIQFLTENIYKQINKYY